MHERKGQVAVIFTSVRTADDDASYGEAAAAMERLAAEQPGYCGFESARGSDAFGISISYWADAPSAIAWRDNARHKAIRDQGRARWYSRYDIVVADVTRSYDWHRP